VLRLPGRNVTEAARRNFERFRGTSAARDLDADVHVWSVVEWSWEEGPPMRLVLRSELGEVWDFIMDETGTWRIERDPNVPRQVPG
jgi:hypothetical protein